MTTPEIPTQTELKDSYNRIQFYVHQTPVLTSQQINEIAGAELFFKCENFQKVGAFKFRGAINAVLQLTDDEKKRGVITHSSGNHAQALALAARMLNISVTIVMPETAPKVKSAAVADYGARIIWCKADINSRERTMNEEIDKSGAIVVHPFDNHHIICGQSTAVQELIKKHDELDIIIAPVGGGGLLSGTALATKYKNSSTAVIGAEPEGADDAYRSFYSGNLLPSVNPNTIADGLLTSLSARTFNIISTYVDDILLANDEEILSAMHLTWERLKIIIEPSSAVPLAVVLKNRQRFAGKRIGIILSGGNVALKKFSFASLI